MIGPSLTIKVFCCNNSSPISEEATVLSLPRGKGIFGTCPLSDLIIREVVLLLGKWSYYKGSGLIIRREVEVAIIILGKWSYYMGSSLIGEVAIREVVLLYGKWSYRRVAIREVVL